MSEKSSGMKGGQSWSRVTGPNLHPWNIERAEVNKTRKSDPAFVQACANAGVEITKRQASKWNNRKGVAYKVANHIEMSGFIAPVV